jgi:hypothetical protein
VGAFPKRGLEGGATAASLQTELELAGARGPAPGRKNGRRGVVPDQIWFAGLGERWRAI